MNYLIWFSIFMIAPLILLIGGVLLYRSEIITDNLDIIGRSMIVLFIIGYIWDAYAVHAGWWFYKPHQIVNIWILGLPIEEYVFIFATILFYTILTLVALDIWGDEK